MEEPLSPFILPKENLESDFFTKYRYPLLLFLIAGLAVGIYLVLTPPTSPLDETALVVDENQIASNASATPISSQIVVDIAGGVAAPGVYHLPTDSIIEDAITKSGGFSTLADLNEIARSINRAELVTDHSKIYIPKLGDNKIVYVNPSASPASVNSALININSATNTELKTLPGIGEITAQRIIDYRLEHGSFSSIDDIKNVTGISDNKFAQIEELIRV
ncbi:MAG: helix-hairpin-helix domain-containing protein [Patescibacteria group bacterium]|nr:helix-hairpin-helix domain-containing protein [Patescibacteria group bacterium]